MCNSIIVDNLPKKVWDLLIVNNKKALFYHSPYYHDLLKSYLNCQLKYNLISDSSGPLAVLPMMISSSLKYGKVINSLPYYGSNGSVIYRSDLSYIERCEINKIILKTLNSYIDDTVSAITIIMNPNDSSQQEWFEANFKADFVGFRIGQITELPTFNEDCELKLFQMYSSPRPRNIRKAIKSGAEVYHSNNKEDLKFLYNVHQENIRAIGGISKEWLFFDNVINYIPAENFKIWVCKINNIKVSALLVFYYNKTVEYFTPATLQDYRKFQPSSLIIHKAMINASMKNYRYWNWGGTWESQKGVYDFKKKWNANDFKYKYFTKVFNKEILNIPKQEILKTYPYFYVLPFN
jgi:hypothetical protein